MSKHITSDDGTQLQDIEQDIDDTLISMFKTIPVYDGTQLQDMEKDICQLQGVALKSFLGMYTTMTDILLKCS